MLSFERLHLAFFRPDPEMAGIGTPDFKQPRNSRSFLSIQRRFGVFS